MKLTRSVAYAVGVLLRVHQFRENRPMTAARIADGCDLPSRFLYRILRKLVDGGLLTGVSGPGGGYRLARAAKDISLLEIVVAIEGPLEATLLEPVQRKQKKAIDLINAACQHSADGFCKELRKLSLQKLGEAG